MIIDRRSQAALREVLGRYIIDLGMTSLNIHLSKTSASFSALVEEQLVFRSRSAYGRTANGRDLSVRFTSARILYSLVSAIGS
jgi:hypothetical protein